SPGVPSASPGARFPSRGGRRPSRCIPGRSAGSGTWHNSPAANVGAQVCNLRSIVRQLRSPGMSFSILPRSWAAPLLSVLRIMTGLLFLEDGTGKLFGFPHLAFAASMPAAMLYFTGIMEFLGGVLITLGLFTRPAAFVLSGYMAVA